MRLIVDRQEHEVHMNTLEEQRNEFGTTIDLKMLNLEINWRNLEVQGGHGEFNFATNSDAYTAIINSTASGVNTEGRVNPPAFANFVFFAQKIEKNCAFESILVTNSYERTCYAPLLSDLEILAVDAPPLP